MTNNHIPPDVRLRNLFEKGSAVDVHKNIPIRRYFRSCQELIRMAGVYFDEKNFENSYVFYAKFIVLSFEKLKTHPEFNNVPASEKLANKRSLKIAFERAEKLKPALKKKYEEEYKIYLANKKKQEILAKQEEEKRKKTEENERIRKEEEKKKEEEEQMNAFVREQKRKELELERLAIEAEFAEKAKIDDDVPLVPTSFAPAPPVVNQIPAKPDPTPSTQPAIPTYDRALKPVDLTDHYKTQEPNDAPPQNVSFAASLTQSKNQYGLRTILSPADLPQKFMALVHTNTARNIETCGVLFGKLANEVFVLTHVLIPHQKGAPDSCDTTREEDMWDFQDQYNGICLGWIHTHPSQTAFLSSVDMHTHYPYQCLMPESVAIVCSGKFNETGYFMLDPGRGMNEIGNCRKHGFHPHPTTPPLFESCDHVKTSAAHSIQLIDWRTKPV